MLKSYASVTVYSYEPATVNLIAVHSLLGQERISNHHRMIWNLENQQNTSYFFASFVITNRSQSFCKQKLCTLHLLFAESFTRRWPIFILVTCVRAETTCPVFVFVMDRSPHIHRHSNASCISLCIHRDGGFMPEHEFTHAVSAWTTVCMSSVHRSRDHCRTCLNL